MDQPQNLYCPNIVQKILCKFIPNLSNPANSQTCQQTMEKYNLLCGSKKV